jgi:thiosulfate/3-mercaptopyruvate sulfurtransferase
MNAVLFAIATIANLLVSTDWLAQNLARTTVVHVGTSASFAEAHIPGAHFLDVAKLAVRRTGRSDELPQINELQKTIEELGVGTCGRIVIYGDEPAFASRLFFTLDYLGQGRRIALLDGGLAKWKSESRRVAAGPTPHASRPFTARIELERMTLFTQLRAAKGTPVLDTRSAEEFAKGHVPGAIHVRWDASPDELRKRLGVAPPARVIVYDETGMRASWTYFTLRSLGYHATLYDGGYEEWREQPLSPPGSLP